MQNTCIVIQTSCENAQVAENIQHALISQQLAACIQSSEIKSTYLWQGKIESASEIKFEIKTKSTLFDAVSTVIKQKTSYDCPEIIALPITQGDKAYLDWIIDSTNLEQA
jgi:periplasmic divalent cation tolerance protein